jgi:hypothetical protein
VSFRALRFLGRLKPRRADSRTLARRPTLSAAPKGECCGGDVAIPQIDPAHWRLRIPGEVERETALTREEVLALVGTVREATLDCTGGWYTLHRRSVYRD